MDARILRGEVAAAGVHLAHEPPAVRQHGGDPGARSEAAEPHLEPVAGGAAVPEQDQPAADRVDRDVDVAVVVVVGRREPAAVRAPDGVRPDGGARVGELAAPPFAGQVLQHLDPLRVLRQVLDRDRAVGEDEIEIAVEIEIDPGHAPAGEVLAERRREVGTRVREGGRRAPVRGMQLPARVRHEEVVAPVEAVVRGRDAHARVRVVDALTASALDEAEAEAVRAGDVQVEPVRVEVIRDVEVEAAVVVHVREDRTETVIDPSRLEPGALADLAEPRAAVSVVAQVEVEAIAHAGDVRREAARGPGHGSVDVGITGDEQVGAPVAVHVADGGARVPARLVDPGRAGAFRERAVAVAPEQRVVAVRGGVVARRRHEQVGLAVLVEVGRDAAGAAELHVGAGAAADVLEPPAHVVEERAARQPAALRPLDVVLVAVRVDDEEVEPAVVVVVEPAEAAAHHRLLLVRDPEPEPCVREVEPDRRRDVLQPHAAEGVGAGDRGNGGLRRAARGGDHVAAVLQHELVGPVEPPARAAALDRPRHAGDHERRRLAVRGYEAHLHALDRVARYVDRVSRRCVDLLPQPGEPGAVRARGCALAVTAPQRLRLVLEVGHEVEGDALRRARVDRCDSGRRPNGDLRRRAGRCGEDRRLRARAGRDPGDDEQADERDGAAECRCTRRAPASHRPAAAAQRVADQHERRPGRADERQRGEQGDLRPELGRLRRDQERREQSERDGVDPATGSPLGDRLRVGDHEEEEDEDLGREGEHAPELPVRDRADVPARGHVVAARGEHGDRRRERHPERDRDPEQAQSPQDREAPDDDDRERERQPEPHRPPPELERVGELRPEQQEAEHEAEVRGVEHVAAPELDQVLREQRDGCRPREDPPAVHAPPVAVLGPRHPEDERDAVTR